jgi:spermidine synthase
MIESPPGSPMDTHALSRLKSALRFCGRPVPWCWQHAPPKELPGARDWRKTSWVKYVAVRSKPPPAPEPGLSRAVRGYLYLTAAVTGAAVMVVEILGAKMLSPYLGLSHFVWTAQIAVTLVALACGYYAGGRLADRSPRLAWLYWAILGGAIYLDLTVLLCRPVAYWCLDTFNSLAVGSLLTSAFLFFLPLALLAITGPFLVRVMTSSVAGVGSSVGRLISIGTLGSFAGTLLISYLMIPFLANSVTMYLTASALMLVCLGYFIFFGRRVAAPVAMTLVCGTVVGLQLNGGPAVQISSLVELFRGNSNFGQLQVLEQRDGSCRYYLNDFLFQNTYDPARKQSRSYFTYMLSGLARASVSNINDVLCIGLGIGIVPMDFARGGARVDVVEINPAVAPVAVRFFDLQRDKITLTIDDGRHFLNRCPEHYDAVILDAFLGDSSPSHLMTREAFESMRRVLRPGGALVINSFGNLDPDHDFFSASLDRTLKRVFRSVRMCTSGDGGIFFAATDRPTTDFVHPPDLEGVHPAVLHDTQAAYVNVVSTPPGHGLVLTDDYNPAEFFDAHNRETTRRRLALMLNGE